MNYIYMLDTQYNLTSFYDLSKMLLGELPTQFEFFYAIFAVAIAGTFIALILAFFGLCLRAFKGRF